MMDARLIPGAIITLARREARNAVELQWQAQGIRRWDYAARDLAKAAAVYFDQHRPELIAKAEALFAKIETDAQRRRA